MQAKAQMCLAWALQLPPQVFPVMHDTARSERFSYSCSVVALRAAMETVDSEGLAASAAAAVQERIEKSRRHRHRAVPLTPEEASRLPPPACFTVCRADRGKVRFVPWRPAEQQLTLGQR
eukprot:jgi/Astpho2/6364/fgenesh1_pg.00091_%23_26_t